MPYLTQNMVMNDWKSSTTKMGWIPETLDHCYNQKVIIFSFQVQIAVIKGPDGMEDCFHKCSAYSLYSELLGFKEINICPIDTIQFIIKKSTRTLFPSNTLPLVYTCYRSVNQNVRICDLSQCLLSMIHGMYLPLPKFFVAVIQPYLKNISLFCDRDL